MVIGDEAKMKKTLRDVRTAASIDLYSSAVSDHRSTQTTVLTVRVRLVVVRSRTPVTLSHTLASIFLFNIR